MLTRVQMALMASFLTGTFAAAQTPLNTLDHVTHSASLTFMRRDHTCLTGTIGSGDATDVTVNVFNQPQVAVRRDTLLRVSQGNALLYSARSSWADVVDARLYPREALVLTVKNGKQIKGRPVKTSADSIILHHGLSTTVFPKSEVVAVDYLRTKPATDGFNLALEEAPYALFLYPEFYYRVAGLEGRIPVRLYDASKPEDDTHLACSKN